VSYWESEGGADALWAVQLSAVGLILVWVLAKRAGDPRRAVREGTGSRAGREIGKDG